MTNEQAAKTYAWAQHGYDNREKNIAERAFMAGLEYSFAPLPEPEEIISEEETVSEAPVKRGRKKKE